MKKRSTKKSRNDETRKKFKNLKKLKNVKIDIAVNLPKVGSFLVRKATFTYLLAIISFIGINQSLIKEPSISSDCINKISQRITLDCSPWMKLPNPYKLIKKCDVTQKVTPTALSRKISPILKNTPMEKMTVEISKREQPVAALLVAIAMKESKFGKYSPKKNGKDCFNYWGYRGQENPTQSGYSCFDNPKQAVKVVGNRIAAMVKKGAKTPADMIAWKCGSTCAGHDPESVRKWIADVGIHFYNINPAVQIAKK
jgi:hypothetical protein